MTSTWTPHKHTCTQSKQTNNCRKGFPRHFQQISETLHRTKLVLRELNNGETRVSSGYLFCLSITMCWPLRRSPAIICNPSLLANRHCAVWEGLRSSTHYSMSNLIEQVIQVPGCQLHRNQEGLGLQPDSATRVALTLSRHKKTEKGLELRIETTQGRSTGGTGDSLGRLAAEKYEA